jgi:DNA-binding GntR family transcriptional regulator
MRKRTESKDLGLESLPVLQQRKSLGQHVFEHLKQAIIRGQVQPGKWLVESHIAEALDISRTPVREAIHKLEREGLVKKQPRGGITVLGLNRADIEETFGIRSVLESYAARLAALKHRRNELKPLEKKIEEFQRHLDKKHWGVLPRINTEFHDLLYALSKSPKLIHLINGLQDQIYRFRKIILEQENMAHQSNEDHRLMLELIRRRDAEGVERLVREHILRGQDVVLKSFDEQHKT